MMHPRLLVLLTVLVAAGAALPAAADMKINEGHWRLELSGAGGVHQGSKDRSGDTKLQFIAEYEFPATKRLTLGLRLTPLFFYDGPSEDVYGAGVGLATRLYQKKESYTGWYLELHCDALVHENRFEANSSNLNFQTGLGAGYQFDGGWHLMFQYEHISNASLGERNSGANTLGFAAGFRF